MTEYALVVFGICCVVGVLSLITYGSGRAEAVSLGIITLFIISSPIAEALGGTDPEGWFDFAEAPELDIDSGYGEYIEEAFADGIASAVAEKFDLDKEDIGVRLYGFDERTMTAERARVILSGRAALADSKAIQRYLGELSVGECSVEIEIG